MKANIIPALAVVALVTLTVLYIDAQFNSIKYHSFSIGCLDVSGMTPADCHSLAEQYLKGK